MVAADKSLERIPVAGQRPAYEIGVLPVVLRRT
jgi:hypothetical protein